MKMDLAGTWELELEDGKTGSVTLPGALQAQGYGDEVTVHTPFVQSLADPLWYEREEYQYGQKDAVRIPYFAQPPRTYYGKAWYRRELFLEQGSYELFLECVKWKSEIRLDDVSLGSCDLLCAPHTYEMNVTRSGMHCLVICVDNSWQHPYRPDGHEVSDALGATWNGVGGSLRLKRHKEAWILGFAVFPDRKNETARVVITIGGDVRAAQKISFIGTALEETWIRVKGRTVEAVLSYAGEVKSWDEFEPYLYELKAVLLGAAGESLDERRTQFGFRELETRDGKFYLNDRPVYFRGTHFGGEYPLTGVPEVSDAYWMHMMETLKKWGFNFLRCHSYCPPEAAFAAADKAGIYLQIECGMWNVFGEASPMVQRLNEETAAIIKAFGNHPSFVLFSPSNEPGGDWEHGLSGWAGKWKREDDRHLYTMQSGWPYSRPPKKLGSECGDYLYFHRSGFGIEPGGTIRNAKGYGDKDYRESVEDCAFPIICHEMGQWCAYPDFSVREKFTGYMRPGNYEVFAASAAAHGVAGQNADFVRASGKLQVQMYKQEIEANMRTPHLYGFEMLDLHDYLGQGTAVVGILDPFWDSKGYIAPAEWQEFCSPTVILLRLATRIYTCGEKIAADAELCHFGRAAIAGAKLYYRLVSVSGEERRVLKERQFLLEEIEETGIGKNIPLPKAEFTLPENSGKALHLVIEAELPSISRNHWDIFVFPETTAVREAGSACGNSSADVRVTRNPADALAYLRDGERVLLFPPKETLNPEAVPLQFYPVFWNAQMGPKEKRNLGLLVQKNHPAFWGFPTEAYVQAQWETILDHAMGMDVERFGERICNLAQPVDDWNRNKKLSMIFETNVGDGQLLVAAFDPETGIANRALAECLRTYLSCPQPDGDSGNREYSITEEEFADLFCDRTANAGAGLRVRKTKLPARYEIVLQEETLISEIVYVPDQTDRNHEEDWKEVTVRAGTVSKEYKLATSFAPKHLAFEKPVRTDRVELVVHSIYEAAGSMVWTEREDGWYKEKLMPQETLHKLPGLYVLSPNAEDFATMSGRFAAMRGTPAITAESEPRDAAKKAVGTRDIED